MFGFHASITEGKPRAVLATTEDLRDSTINVDVDNEVVTLSGTVATQAQKNRAAQIAKGVEGVKSVKNNLVVSVTMNDLEDAMGDISFRHSKSLIDEIPMAYKDIDEVMENSKELLQVDHTLKQIINIKGD
jgi:RNA-splicing ligase RtcB